MSSLSAPAEASGLETAAHRWGMWVAAFVAACAALPGLWFPFLSDDWAQIRAVMDGPVPRTPFGDFRPLFMTTLWIDRLIGGLSPRSFHLTNLLLIAAATAWLVVTIRRYTGSAALATATGLLFALHPYHVESAAWIAARADPLCAILMLAAACAYDRWRSRLRRLPVAAMLLFEAALLAKEAAALLPLMLILIGWLDRSRHPSRREWIQGHLSLILVGACHLLGLRTWVLGGAGRTLLGDWGLSWLKHAFGYIVASIVPLDTETLIAHPAAAGASTALVILALLARPGALNARVPPLALGAGAIFAVLLIPALVGFQERYLFIPGAASTLALVALIRGRHGRQRVALGLLLVVGWIAGACERWGGWRETAVASQHLIQDLERASGRPETSEIIVANMPLHVRGGSVAGDFRSALALAGARPVQVRAASYFDYASATSDALNGSPEIALTRPPPYAEVRLHLSEGPHARFVGPSASGLYPDRRTSGELETSVGTILLDGRGGVRVRIRPDPVMGRVSYAWVEGRLVELF